LSGATTAEAMQHSGSRTLMTRTATVNAEMPQTPRSAPWQFSLRSLLLFTAALAGMLSAMKMLGTRLLPSVVLLFVASLLPVWLPLFFLPAESLRQRLRPLLALIPAVWYLCLIDNQWWRIGYYLGWTRPFLLLMMLALGYGIAAIALAFSARGRRHLINVPLWLALLASAWAIFSR
jgi:hypothetical protein